MTDLNTSIPIPTETSPLEKKRVNVKTSLVLILVFVVFVVFSIIVICIILLIGFARTGGPVPGMLYQTCIVSSNSQGCTDCLGDGERGSICLRCEELNDLKGPNNPLADSDLEYYLEYCSEENVQEYRTCKSFPTSKGCQSCTEEGSTGELCQFCESNFDSISTIEFQRKCEFPVEGFRNYTNPGTYIDGEFVEMDPFELIIDNAYKEEFTFEGYYHKDMATIIESDDSIGFTARYDFEDYTMDIIVENELHSTINNEPVYYSYNTDVTDNVETKYLGKLKKLVYSDVYYFSDSYLTEECKTIANMEESVTFLESPCGSRLIKSTEVKDATDWTVSGLGISCIAQRQGVVMEHTSESSTICFEFVNNLLVKSRNFE